MPRTYSSDLKAAAMVAVERNNGNIQLVAQQFNIAENTLYAWRRNIQVFFQQNPLPPQYTAEVPAFENDLETLAFIRQNILGELSRLSASMQYDSGFSTPYQRALVMSQLMDRLLKLDVHLKPYMEEEEEIITYERDDEEDEEVEIINYERDYPRPERDEGDYDPPA
ncbi:MAG: transposase [Chloroflexota bacterium]